jgi:DNA-binding NtrC family response regulator
MDTIKIKIIEGEESKNLKKRIKQVKSKYHLLIETTENLENCINEINTEKFEVLILTNEAVEIYKNNVFKLIQSISQNYPKIQILLFIEEKNIAAGVEALKYGAYQYIKLPVSEEELELIIDTTIEQIPQIVDESKLEDKNKKNLVRLLVVQQRCCAFMIKSHKQHILIFLYLF